ncbi:DNA-J related domain-containing protein [Saccharophagus degradans]|uniref:DNA-J related domain-containing protein n=1 Tax=Saccharophagus degradans TaxID=86304 RepID=A0AAW7X4H2_9GAMM|nr:DNA-J related domain-containing protein [Saccharophagus degradans]MDO6421279.1 DNA-J related domain-containing protein [Saccharophagus degradans]MDO6605810.1 DNA-J related domain-containing protein [Saccharophagus degradans]
MPTAIELIDTHLKQNGVAKEYDLITLVNSQCDIRWSANANIALFQKHFLIQHCLYRIQQFLPDGCALTISPLLIQYYHSDSNVTSQLSNNVQSQELANYYLDWTNFDAATEDSVVDLLTGFWKKYAAHQAGDDDYQTLGLDSNSEWQDVQSAYRRLASSLHPDKGGSAVEFNKVHAAYQRLKQRR